MGSTSNDGPADGADALAAVASAITAVRNWAGLSQSALPGTAEVNRLFLASVEVGTRKPTVITPDTNHLSTAGQID